ncbi:AraC family transcriptional regulator [Ginsengibacter hankyongi]|uniref:AraC family transcriptional regulator n=1 Tax=Ginsengibacter hankyongi TaxID=2607284 RepID=A0A5J5IB75_9BACT|nr:AraC family transcriptional regulator [Ginsengibacter hankyongi]KAA9034358.1 AraC family transcriptional regulator [Ginsengibacter hankyongi]
MKPQLLKVSAEPSCSFSVRQDRVPYVNNRWHYHPEIELIYFKEGRGTQFIGDNISLFNSGDVILVGANLPHYWSFDETYFNSQIEEPNVFVTHFCDYFWGKDFLTIPENLPIKNILETAKRGIQITGPTREFIGNLLEKMLVSDGCNKIILILEALVNIAHSGNYKILSSIGFQHNVREAGNDRINSIYEFSLANYKRKILMEEAAAIACMSPNSFCRYFKSKTRKTYSNFLIEIRVGIACKLLIANNLSIKQICFESGFNNFASFHKFFKMITGKTPLNYQREFISKN